MSGCDHTPQSEIETPDNPQQPENPSDDNDDKKDDSPDDNDDKKDDDQKDGEKNNDDQPISAKTNDFEFSINMKRRSIAHGDVTVSPGVGSSSFLERYFIANWYLKSDSGGTESEFKGGGSIGNTGLTYYTKSGESVTTSGISSVECVYLNYDNYLAITFGVADYFLKLRIMNGPGQIKTSSGCKLMSTDSDIYVYANKNDNEKFIMTTDRSTANSNCRGYLKDTAIIEVFMPYVIQYYDNPNDSYKWKTQTFYHKDYLMASTLNPSSMPEPSKTGHTFSGWKCSACGKKLDSKYESTPYQFLIEHNSECFTGSNSSYVINLDAMYTANTYTVSFDSNGGTAQSSLSVEYGSLYGDLPTPTKTGYTFDGWEYNGSIITASSRVSTASDHTLTAQWTANQYWTNINVLNPSGGEDCESGTFSVAYHDAINGWDKSFDGLSNEPNASSTGINGVSGANERVTLTYGSTITIRNISIVPQYKFKSISGPSMTDAGNGVYTFTITEDSQTIEILTDDNPFNVTFVAGEGVSDSSKFVTYGESYGELPSPSATGKEFLGWYTGSKVGNLFDPYNFVDYMKQQKPDNNLTSFDGKYLQIAGGWTHLSSINDYVYYKPSYLKEGLTYALSYKAQSQDSNTTSEQIDFALGIFYTSTNNEVKVLKDTNVNDYSIVFTLQEGFKGFYVGYNYGRVINVWDISLTVVTSTSANLFDPYSYVNYMKEQKPDNNLTSYDGKNLQIAGGWTHQNGDYIYWKPNYLKTGYTYTLKYKAQSQDSGTTAEQPDSALRIGYSKTDSYGLSLSDTNVHEYSVTFTLQEDFRGFYAGYNYGRRIKVWDICVTFGTTANTDLFDTYDFVDYVKQQKEDNNNTTFDGIYLNLHGAWTYTDDYIYYKPSYLVTGKTYTLSYNAQCDMAAVGNEVSGLGINYGTQYGYSVSMNSSKVYNYSATFTLQAGFKGIYVGYNHGGVFKVWNICLVEGSSEGKSDDYSDLVESFTTVTTAKDHSLYGAWASKSYTVTFDANGGSVNPASKVVYYEESYGSLPTPTRANYEFMGWSGAVSVPDFSQWTMANGASYDASTGILTMGTETAAAYSPVFYVGEMSSLYFYIYAMCNTDSDLNTGVDYYSDANTAYSANGWSGKFTSQGVEVGKWGWTRTLYGKSTEISSGTCRYVRLGIFRDSRFAPQTFYVKKCMLSTTDNYPKTYTTSATKVTTPANHTLVADWKPIARNVTIRVRSSKSGEPNAFEESAAGLKDANYNYYDCPTNGNDTTKCLRALTAAYTNFNHAQGQSLSFLEVTAEDGYVFLGCTTTDAAPTVIAAPETTKSWTISADTTIYLWLKKVSSNQLKYDEEEKYWYFEDGMTLQSYVGNTLNTTLNNNIDNTTAVVDTIAYYKNGAEQTVKLYDYNGETFGGLAASKTMVKKRLKLNANTYFYNGTGSYSSDGLAAKLNASAFSGNRYSDCYIQMYCGNDASGNGIYKNFEFLVSEDSNSKCFEFTKTADMRTVILKFNGNLQDAFIGFYDETSPNSDHTKLLENEVTYRLTFNYEIAADKITAKAWNITLSEVFKKDQTYWFKYEPIRWRVSSYGVEKDDLLFCNAYWKDYGSFNKSFMYVSDKIVFASQMTANQFDMGDGKSYISRSAVPFVTTDDNITYSMNKAFLEKSFSYLITVDEYYTKFNDSKAGTDSTKVSTHYRLRVASVEELQTNFSDLRAKPTDYVAFLLGVNPDQYCNYFTRDVGKKYYNMTGIGVDGRVHDYYTNNFMGMRLAMNFSEGSRY